MIQFNIAKLLSEIKIYNVILLHILSKYNNDRKIDKKNNVTSNSKRKKNSFFSVKVTNKHRIY